MKETTHEVELMEERINGLNEQLNALRENREEKISKLQKTVEETKTNITNRLGEVDEKTKNVVEKESLIDDKETQKTRMQQALDMEKQLENARKKAIKEIEFYEKHDECPTCQQGLDHEHKKKHVEEKTAKTAEIKEAIKELETRITKINTRLEEISVINDEITEIQKEIGIIQTEILANQKYMEKIQGTIEELKLEVAGNSDVHTRLEESEDKLDILHAKKESLVDQGHYYDIATTLLRDQGVKERIIKQYVPIMNKLINKYLAQLEFYVGFELNESFEETIKSRFRDVFKYDNFSQGEKMRIDLSLLFTWRAVARMKNSVNTNLLILDEVFDSSLDVNGTDEFMKLLNTLTEKTNAFIISHKGDALYDKFEHVIRFEKYKNFSRVAE